MEGHEPKAPQCHVSHIEHATLVTKTEVSSFIETTKVEVSCSGPLVRGVVFVEVASEKAVDIPC